MYSAYQSGQFASCWPPERFSCSPCAAAARRSALARSVDEVKGRVSLDTSRQSLRDLLEQPAVAVRIIERGERTVAVVLGIRAMEPNPAKQIRLVGSGVRVGRAMERFADLDTATNQIVASGVDVGNDQIESLGGTRCRRGYVLAEDHRAPASRVA